jgi:hypothetical protein
LPVAVRVTTSGGVTLIRGAKNGLRAIPSGARKFS